MIWLKRFIGDYVAPTVVMRVPDPMEPDALDAEEAGMIEMPAVAEQLSRAFHTTFQECKGSHLLCSRVSVSDGETEQTYLLAVDAEPAAAEYPIKVYPLIPSAKELFGYKEKADDWKCCIFGITNDSEHAGEVILSTPHLKRIGKQLRERGYLTEAEVSEFVQEVADWTLRTSMLRKTVSERRKNKWKMAKRPPEYTTAQCARCKRVVLSQRAYLSILAEAVSRDPLETGGVLLGHYDKNGTWHVVEATDPGLDTYHSVNHNEMDDKYHNHLYRVLSRLYEHGLCLVGLWHRHPGSYDRFSMDDDNTNRRFAEAIGNGTLSFLINFDSRERLTCYYLDQEGDGKYHKLPVYIGDKYFKRTGYLELTTPQAIWSEKRRLQDEIQNG